MDDLDVLRRAAIAMRARAEAATPGRWERGDRYHVQGASHCQCRPEYGPIVTEKRMDINGTMMLAHVHRRTQPLWEHGINTFVDGEPLNVVNDTDEYGYMLDEDAEHIAGMDPTVALAVATLMDWTAMQLEVNPDLRNMAQAVYVTEVAKKYLRLEEE